MTRIPKKRSLDSINELVKSANRLSWAISLFGIQQLGTVISGNGSAQPGKEAARMRVTERRPNDFFANVSQARNERLPCRLTDLVRSVLMLRDFMPRDFSRTALEMMGQSADFFKYFSSETDGRIAWDEFKNKIQAFSLFEHVDSALGLTPGSHCDLKELVDRARKLGPSFSAWAVEGVGHYYTNLQLGHKTLLTHLLSCEEANALPSSSLVPLHTGMGLALAEFLLRGTSGQPPHKDKIIHEFADLCQNNSREGYWGATFEAIGLVVRNLYPHWIGWFDHCLRGNEELLVYFWHGIGRGNYFSPINFLPFRNAPWQGLEMCWREPPHALGQHNAIAGFVWALTLVNIKQPEIMATFLKHHGSGMENGRAFANGIGSALIVWRDAAPDDPYLDAFQRYMPDSDRALAELWIRYVRQSCNDAVNYHRRSGGSKTISDVFRYRHFS